MAVESLCIYSDTPKNNKKQNTKSLYAITSNAIRGTNSLFL